VHIFKAKKLFIAKSLKQSDQDATDVVSQAQAKTEASEYDQISVLRKHIM